MFGCAWGHSWRGCVGRPGRRVNTQQLVDVWVAREGLGQRGRTVVLVGGGTRLVLLAPRLP